jgi:hypothetical protein
MGRKKRHPRRRARSVVSREFRAFALGSWRRCQWCNEPLTEATATTDHVVPRSRGGKDHWANLVLSCYPCNHGRANRPAERWPVGPKWSEGKRQGWWLQDWYVWLADRAGAWERIRSPYPTLGDAKLTAERFARTGVHTRASAFLYLPDCLTPSLPEARLFPVLAAKARAA